jgi:hypothetical protein
VGAALVLGFFIAPHGGHAGDGRADGPRSGRKRRRSWLRSVDELLGGGVVAAVVKRVIQREGRELLQSVLQYASEPPPEERGTYTDEDAPAAVEQPVTAPGPQS